MWRNLLRAHAEASRLLRSRTQRYAVAQAEQPLNQYSQHLLYQKQLWGSGRVSWKYVLRMEVHQHGQVAVDDPLGEVVVVLHVEGDAPVWGKKERARRRQKGPRVDRGAQGGRAWQGGRRQRGGGEAARVFHRDGPDSPHEQPSSHLGGETKEKMKILSITTDWLYIKTQTWQWSFYCCNMVTSRPGPDLLGSWNTGLIKINAHDNLWFEQTVTQLSEIMFIYRVKTTCPNVLNRILLNWEFQKQYSTEVN